LEEILLRIAIGADHAGLALKDRLRARLEEAGYQVEDVGTHDAASVDYPDYAAAVGRRVSAGQAERGVLVCGTGVGMAMAANRIPGVRAACCNNLFVAGLSREHNDANVLTLGAREVAAEHAEAILKTFLETAYAGGRHQRRVDKLARLEAGGNPRGDADA
jgi:ribose 5-phosphate isomerase B